MNFLNIRWGRVYHSIIFRVVMFGILGVGLVNGTRAYLSLKHLEADTTASVTAQQQALSRNVADDIAHKLAMRQSTLLELAHTVPTALLDQPEVLREWLRGQHAVLAQLFDGLSVERDDGAIIAAYPTIR